MANTGEAERTINEDAIAGAEGRLDRLEALADKLEVQIEEIESHHCRSWDPGNPADRRLDSRRLPQTTMAPVSAGGLSRQLAKAWSPSRLMTRSPIL